MTRWLVLLFTLFVACGPSATQVTPQKPDLSVKPPQGPKDEILGLDSRVRTGTLPSGLTYYVLQHKKPEKRAQIWLAVNAGSVLEDDDQRGLAHFVEHMSFNGTKRFPKQAIVDMLEKSGVAFGADLNAYTNFDETVYTLQVPTDKSELVDKAISVIRDWSDADTFDPTEVEKERGVVLEEWRLGRGAGMRIFDKQAPVLFHGSKYADRITIGKPEIIKGAPPATLKRFYDDWYRPDLMAVIAVGDFSPDEIEAKIKAEFGNQKARANERPKPVAAMPAHEQELVTVETDPEMTMSSISITTKMPRRTLTTVADYRRVVAERLFNTMLSARFDELRRKPGTPFLFAASRSGYFVRSADAFTQGASVKEGDVRAAFAALLEEELRVERHGFTASEFERAKTDIVRQYEQSVKERDATDGKQFAREIVRLFLQNEAMPGPEAELALVQKLLPTYTLEELNGIGKALEKGSRVVAISGPAAMAKPTEAQILATTKEVEARKIDAWDDAPPNVPLMQEKPTPGQVVATKTLPEIGVTEWTLKNGVRVVVKPTDFKNDEVRMVGFAPGGTSLAPDADYDTARFADTIVGQGGIGPFDATQLRKALTGKIVTVGARIGELDEGISGGASPSDLESMFQLTYLSFTAPRRDQAAFDSWRAREIEMVKNRKLSPEGTFGDEMLVFTTQNHRRRQPITPETLQKVDLDKAFAFYKDRFADAAGFTFVLVGNLDLDKTKTLVETYLGSLPSKAKKEAWKDPNVRRPNGVAKKMVVKGREPKSSVALTFHGPETWSRDADNDMRMLGEVLRIRLREILREDMGGVYGVSAGGGVSRRPRQEYTFAVSFGCAPENIDKLEKAVWDEIATIQQKGIGQDYIDKVKELRKRAHETNLKENGWWLRELERSYTFGDDPKQVTEVDPFNAKVTSDRVKAAANKYLKKTQYMLGELRPETTP